MESLEISGKTVEEAVQAALSQLGLTEEEVEIAVLKEGRKGILGLGTEEARVLVTPKARATPTEATPQATPACEPVLNPPLPEPVAQARTILETLLSGMRISATVEAVPCFPASEDDGPALALNIKGTDLGILIGRRGQTLSTLQYMVNLILSQKTRIPHPIVVDVEEYKQRRYQSLHTLAQDLAEQVKKNRRSLAMEPMPSDERRIVHLALAKDPEISTESAGEGDGRKVIISLKKTRA
ncbi:MAG: protein jag [Chloroflexi bacterium]|nr:protein jag [Chloroflexota bacterium]